MRPLLVAGLLVWMAALGLAQQSAPARPACPAVRPSSRPDAASPGFERTVKPFLATHCFECHGNESHKTDLNFESMTSVETLIERSRALGQPS